LVGWLVGCVKFVHNIIVLEKIKKSLLYDAFANIDIFFDNVNFITLYLSVVGIFLIRNELKSVDLEFSYSEMS